MMFLTDVRNLDEFGGGIRENHLMFWETGDDHAMVNLTVVVLKSWGYCYQANE